MHPVLVIQHEAQVRPGFCTQFLNAQSIPWQLVCIDQHMPLPSDASLYSGIVSMGGSMSVNDDLQWIGQELDLMRQAIDRTIPVLGHCLGGQMLAKALGGAVSVSPHREIGWIDVKAEHHPAAAAWLSDRLVSRITGFRAFQWHGESFSIPPGAERILSNAFCRNQAFVSGPHLGMQFHVEMTEELVREWCETDSTDLPKHAGPATQTANQILQNLAAKIAAQQQIAARLYQHWAQGLAR